MNYLVVDMTRVLRESEHGRVAIESLRGLVERARNQEMALRTKWEKAVGAAKKQARDQFVEFQTQSRKEIDRRKDALQRALVGMATEAAAHIAKERGVDLVVERSAVLVYAEDADVTDVVIARVNAVKVG